MASSEVHVTVKVDCEPSEELQRMLRQFVREELRESLIHLDADIASSLLTQLTRHHGQRYEVK